ncbi:MAG: energy-coupled thiamine transporter ThiT [Clostridiaceae bacterium]|nr:energy-coupled thiamine transporter ThiT [Clostridiaceae bacterium]
MSDHSVSVLARRERILAVATGGVCVSVAFVLSLITVYKMPQGGSVTPASMLPILFFALSFGPGWGLCAAFIFSLLQLIGGYFLMPVQVLFDYTLAFTSLGVAGFFAAPREKRVRKRDIIGKLMLVPLHKAVIGILTAIGLRMFFSVLSGVLFFSEYAGGENPLIYSIFYNGSYLFPEAVIIIIVLFAVMISFQLIQNKTSSGSV